MHKATEEQLEHRGFKAVKVPQVLREPKVHRDQRVQQEPKVHKGLKA